MKRLVWYFIIVLGAVWLGSQMYWHPGYVVILYRHWAIETNPWFLALLILVLYFIIHIVWSLLRGTLRLPSRIGHWWQDRKQRRAVKLFHGGYRNFIAGRWKKAMKQLSKGAKNPEFTLTSYLIASQAADAQGESIKRESYLNKARTSDPSLSHLADILEVQFLLRHHRPEEALTIVLRLREQYSSDPYLLQLLAECYLALKDYSHLQLILPDLKKRSTLDERKYHTISQDTYYHLLKDEPFEQFSDVQLAWNKTPSTLRHDPKVLMAYAKQLCRWNHFSEAEELIRKELKKNYDPDLMDYYVTLPAEKPSRQLAVVEQHLKHRADDPQLLHAMGMLCLKNKLWGQARDYLNASLKRQVSAHCYSALGYVYEKLGEENLALMNYRKGLSLIGPAEL